MPRTPISAAINPSLISFKPRQVLLANPNVNINMKQQSNGKASIPSLKPEQKALLLRSVAAYLNSNGFSKTLKKFLSEAKLEKDEYSDSSLDLEDMYCKFLASCDHGSTTFSKQKVQDLLKDCNSERDKESGKITDSKAIEEVLVDDALPELNKKSKDRKKSKKISDSLSQAEHVSADKVTPVDNMVCDGECHESEKKHKEKKKKKSKLDSESLGNNVEPSAVEDKQDTKAKDVESWRDSQAIETKMANANTISKEGETVKSKSKKKKKDGSASQSLSDGDKEIDKGKSNVTVSKKDDNKTSEEDETVKKSKHSKKRKRLATEENNFQPIEKIEDAESKRRKTEGSEELKGSSQVTEVKTPMGTSECVGNGSDEPKSSMHKSTKKQTNGSAETAKAFQRVKVDEVVFTDARLKDNSYWAKDGAEVGYGAKAQEVLGQVRGRDFRHEKTKKKRGSYRGGQIDLQSHSIKFSYSDED